MIIRGIEIMLILLLFLFSVLVLFDIMGRTYNNLYNNLELEKRFYISRIIASELTQYSGICNLSNLEKIDNLSKEYGFFYYIDFNGTIYSNTNLSLNNFITDEFLGVVRFCYYNGSIYKLSIYVK